MKDDLNLDQFHGTEHYYKHFTGIKYTDGIKYLADKTNCYWFIDIIASYQQQGFLDRSGVIKDIPFQIWKLKTNEAGGALVTMREDTNRPSMISHAILHTDFPLDEIEVYCIGGVILLKSEY